jgi:hypothetical protein
MTCKHGLVQQASKRDEQQEITFPQEKHRTGMIIVASLLGADLKS